MQRHLYFVDKQRRWLQTKYVTARFIFFNKIFLFCVAMQRKLPSLSFFLSQQPKKKPRKKPYFNCRYFSFVVWIMSLSGIRPIQSVLKSCSVCCRYTESLGVYENYIKIYGMEVYHIIFSNCRVTPVILGFNPEYS